MPIDGVTGQLDNSDVVVPDELPNWHIESKAIKNPRVPASRLFKWCKQIKEDCPKGKVAVIIVSTNGYGPVAIMTSDVFKAVARNLSSLTVNAEFSFCPAPELQKLNKGARIYGTLMGKEPMPFRGAIAFEADEGTVTVAVDAELWLAWAASYETQLRQVKEEVKKEFEKEVKLEIVK